MAEINVAHRAIQRLWWGGFLSGSVQIVTSSPEPGPDAAGPMYSVANTGRT